MSHHRILGPWASFVNENIHAKMRQCVGHVNCSSGHDVVALCRPHCMGNAIPDCSGVCRMAKGRYCGCGNTAHCIQHLVSNMLSIVLHCIVKGQCRRVQWQKVEVIEVNEGCRVRMRQRYHSRK